MIKIACQTIVYGNPRIKDNYESIASDVASAGYAGIETGARHFYTDKPEFYAELFRRLGLSLTAVHLGGDFLDADSVKRQLDDFDSSAEFAASLGSKLIYLSGAHQKNKCRDDYMRECEIYSRLGEKCLSLGLTLCYHNHDWEIKNDYEGIEYFVNGIDAKYMSLVPDLGWVSIAEGSPVEFVKRYRSRIKALHFKDYTFDADGKRRFTELGTGKAPLREGFEEFIKTQFDELWITAEQDETSKEPGVSARENLAFIKKIISE